MTYHLHHTYRDPVVKITEPPFLLSKIAWGYFEIRFEIEFKPETGLKKKNLVHMLDFNGGGRTRSILLEVQDTGSEKGNLRAVAAALSSQIDRVMRSEQEAGRDQ